MQDRNKLTRDGDPLVDRGTIDYEEDDDRELPVDETDDGPQPVIIVNDGDDRLRNENDEPSG